MSKGIELNRENILYSAKQNKLEIIKNILEKRRFDSAVFIDDQVDHLVGNNYPEIKTYLALWGYINTDRKTEYNNIKTLQLSEFFALQFM